MVVIILSSLMELNWDNQILGGNLLKAVGGLVVVICLFANPMSLAILKHILLLL